MKDLNPSFIFGVNAHKPLGIQFVPSSGTVQNILRVFSKEPLKMPILNGTRWDKNIGKKKQISFKGKIC